MNKHMMKFLVLLLVWLGSVTGVQAAGGAAVYYIQTDQLNTPRVITDQRQAVVWKWESDGFGATPPNEQPGAAPAFVFNPRFAGQYFDRESGLHYNYFRDYDPQTGRYIQSDPIGLEGGINTYGYVGGDPVGLIDPFGLQTRGLYPRPFPVMPIPSAVPIPSVQDDGDSGRSRSGGRTRETSEPDYHRICDQREPPGLNKCESAKFRLNRAQQCYAAREQYANRHFGGRYDAGHAQQMSELQKAIKNAQKDVKRSCNEDCP